MRNDLKVFHGPEGRQVPSRAGRWMLQNRESELELGEGSCPKPAVSEQQWHQDPTTADPEKPPLASLLQLSFLPWLHQTLEKSLPVLWKNLFSLLDIPQSCRKAQSPEQNQTSSLPAHIPVSLAETSDQLKNHRAFCPNLK